MNFATMLRQMREAVERRLPGQCPTLTVVPRKGLDELLRDYDRIDGLARGAHYSDEQLRARIRELESQIAEQEKVEGECFALIEKNGRQLKKHGDKRREWRKRERSLMCRIMDLLTAEHDDEVRAARAERHLAALEDFAKRHRKADDGEGLLEFYSRLNYRTGLDDSNAGRWLKLMHLERLDHISIRVSNCDLIPTVLDDDESLGGALDKMKLPTEAERNGN